MTSHNWIKNADGFWECERCGCKVMLEGRDPPLPDSYVSVLDASDFMRSLDDLWRDDLNTCDEAVVKKVMTR